MNKEIEKEQTELESIQYDFYSQNIRYNDNLNRLDQIIEKLKSLPKSTDKVSNSGKESLNELLCKLRDNNSFYITNNTRFEDL